MVQFLLIKFLQKGEGDILPITWLDGKTEKRCYWPPASYTNEKITGLIKKGGKPAKNYELWDIQIISSTRYKTFSEAERAFNKKQAEYAKCAAETDDESLRLIRVTVPYASSSLDSPFSSTPTNEGTDDTEPQEVDEDVQEVMDSDNDKDSDKENGDEDPDREIGDEDPDKESNVENSVQLLNASDTDKGIQANNCQGCQKLAAEVKEMLLLLRYEMLPTLQNFSQGNFYDYEIIDEMLPLKTLNELKDFELKLLENKDDFRKKAIKWVIANGGKDETKMMSRTFPKLMTYELAEQFSYQGFRKKKAFNVLEVHKILKTAAKQRLHNYDDDRMDDGIINQLKHAPEASAASADVKTPPVKKRKIQVKLPFYLNEKIQSTLDAVIEVSKNNQTTDGATGNAVKEGGKSAIKDSNVAEKDGNAAEEDGNAGQKD